MEDIRELAIRDPVAAYGIWQGVQRVPFSFSLAGSFATLSAGTGFPVKAATPLAAIAQRVWLTDIAYSLQVPNLVPNQIFKPQFDAGLKESPGIDVRLVILGEPQEVETFDYTPLENVTNLIRGDRWPSGWPLFRGQIVQGTFVLKQAPGGHPSNLGPYNFVLTFNGWQFLDDMKTGSMAPLDASRLLREAGVLECQDVQP